MILYSIYSSLIAPAVAMLAVLWKTAMLTAVENGGAGRSNLVALCG